MICSRCGLCCLNLDVMIIDPGSIRPDGTVDPGDPAPALRKPAKERCPHLSISGDEAVCTIHHLPCYQGTPCDLFDQIGPDDAVCLLGVYLRSLEGEGV
ncbi:MAG: hypothetical protein WBK88_04085 [Methanothrix sp.]